MEEKGIVGGENERVMKQVNRKEEGQKSGGRTCWCIDDDIYICMTINSLVDYICNESKDSHQHGARWEHHRCSAISLGRYRQNHRQTLFRTGLDDHILKKVNEHACDEIACTAVYEELTRWILGLVDGDGGAGEGQAAGVLQGDVDTVGAGFRERSPQVHLALRRWRHVVTHDATHLECRWGLTRWCKAEVGMLRRREYKQEELQGFIQNYDFIETFLWFIALNNLTLQM